MNCSLHCYEYLTLIKLNVQLKEEKGENEAKEADFDQIFANFLKKNLIPNDDLWYLSVFKERNPDRIKQIFQLFQQCKTCTKYIYDDGNYFYEKYFTSNNFRELHLDDLEQNLNHSPLLPKELFRFCPNVEVLSLRGNSLSELPGDVGRLKKLRKLVLTNNRLNIDSLPFTLEFCHELSELYLDHNLLDALPGFLLRMNSLNTVHRHGNHNYFKTTFMWYHTDVNGRILEEAGLNSYHRRRCSELSEPRSLQLMSEGAVLQNGINFFEASIIPNKIKDELASLAENNVLCGNCRKLPQICRNEGYKVFTFKNPYLGNTCVPFQHWACSKDCAEMIEIPARIEEIHSAHQQDEIYRQNIRDTIANMSSPSTLKKRSTAPSLSPSSSSSFRIRSRTSSLSCAIL